MRDRGSLAPGNPDYRLCHSGSGLCREWRFAAAPQRNRCQEQFVLEQQFGRARKFVECQHCAGACCPDDAATGGRASAATDCSASATTASFDPVAMKASSLFDPSVVTVEYDTEWPRIFEAEKGRLRSALGDVAISIEHVGSTSVPNLAAKPIIDIDVFVNVLEPMAPYKNPLESLGYVFRFDPETPELHFFAYPAKPPRRYHVHVAQIGSRHMIEDLAFRDFLRAHPSEADRYAKLKRMLTTRHKGDMAAYYAGKAGFMTEMVARAVHWSKSRSE
jgi:GrpB-like predicted nucleotidyltransferase (UPF0157 family)